MTTILDTVERDTDYHLRELHRLGQLKQRLADEGLDALDVEGTVGICAYDGYASITVSTTPQQDRDLVVKLLELSGANSVDKVRTYGTNMKARFDFDHDLAVSVIRAMPANCQKVKVVRKVEPQVIEVCGEVDEERWEVLEYLDEEEGDA